MFVDSFAISILLITLFLVSNYLIMIQSFKYEAFPRIRGELISKCHRNSKNFVFKSYSTTSTLNSAEGTHKFNVVGRISNSQIGSFSEIVHTFSQEDVNKFAEICGDSNPLHTNPEFAKGTMFKGTIVHGILVSSLFSTLFGGVISGSVYVSQSLKFKRPVHVGVKVRARIELVSVEDKKKGDLITCSSRCYIDGTNELAVDGEAKVLVPKSSE